jgi:cobalamin biosynthesis protein CobD/CbiB
MREALCRYCGIPHKARRQQRFVGWFTTIVLLSGALFMAWAILSEGRPGLLVVPALPFAFAILMAYHTVATAYGHVTLEDRHG